MLESGGVSCSLFVCILVEDDEYGSFLPIQRHRGGNTIQVVYIDHAEHKQTPVSDFCFQE
ncbi:hypothetical protein EYF80_000289 [Liparis tanakae]|uniref:Uncharacterized protein n=1 Tax=Liparis tanakae TaxID=230148 RepID=A0A4Z2JHA5_9TELE|nr:hypothetical protein EYF80_000289 [Liparis tanakae]